MDLHSLQRADDHDGADLGVDVVADPAFDDADAERLGDAGPKLAVPPDEVVVAGMLTVECLGHHHGRQALEVRQLLIGFEPVSQGADPGEPLGTARAVALEVEVGAAFVDDGHDLGQEGFLRLEVMDHGGRGDADPLRDRRDARSARTAFGEQLDRRLQDRVASRRSTASPYCGLRGA